MSGFTEQLKGSRAGHFSVGRQEMGSAGCANTGSLLPPRHHHRHHHHSLQPQCVSHSGHASTSSHQNYSAAALRQPCTFPVFIPPSIPHAVSPRPHMHRTGSKKSPQKWHHPPPTFNFYWNLQKRVWKVFIWVVIYWQMDSDVTSHSLSSGGFWFSDFDDNRSLW